MSEHSEQHEELLLSIAAGELPLGSEAVSKRREACPTCDTRIEALVALVDLLEDEARDARAILEEAAAIESAPGEERIAGLIEHPEIRAVRGSTGLARGWKALAVAAGILVAFLVLRTPRVATGERGSEPTEPRLLGRGDSELRLLEPLDGDGYGHFAWEATGAVADRARSYTLIIEGSEFFDEVIVAAEGPRVEWSDPDRARGFPETIEWRVEAYDASYALLARSERASARRSP